MPIKSSVQYSKRILPLVAICLSVTTLATPALSQETLEKRPSEQDGLDLAIEELLSDKGRGRLEFGVTYNASSQDSVTGAYETIQTGTGAFVSIPTAIGSSEFESDSAIATIGGRYGIAKNTELFARTSLMYSNTRFTNGISGLSDTDDDARFLNFAVGLNHRILEESETPGLIGFVEATVVENVASAGHELVYGKSGTVGFTAYKIYDPVVLSVSTGYRANLERTVGLDSIDPGDTVFISPSLAFAVNNEITLTGGFSLRVEGADKVNGAHIGTRKTQAELEFGVSYAWDHNTTLRFDTRTGVIGERSFSAGLNLSKSFGGD